ncbi:MAG: flavodoxin domain-containing protein [Lachnospiraceae bacterium]|nr:flavodoxin domain-containing protein [Lachnospiraceae bacterium]
MNTIIVYSSQTGFTKQYAQWLGEALDCPYKSQGEVSDAELKEYDCIIYGGWIMGNSIMGLDKFRTKHVPTSIFAVGATPAYDEVICVVKEQNHVDDTPFFYLEGGIRMEKLKFIQKSMLKMLGKSLTKKENATRQEKFMAEKLGTSFDHSSKKQIENLVQWYKIYS